MKWAKAFLAGMAGGAVVTALLSIVIAAGFHVLDFSMMWGTWTGLPIGAAAWIVGFIIQLTVGGLFGLCYAVVFNAFSGASLRRGALFGIVHALITGMFIALLPLVHPLMNSDKMPSPGPFFEKHGLAGILFYFFIHIVYGATVGWIYARTVPSARQAIESDDLRIAA